MPALFGPEGPDAFPPCALEPLSPPAGEDATAVAATDCPGGVAVGAAGAVDVAAGRLEVEVGAAADGVAGTAVLEGAAEVDVAGTEVWFARTAVAVAAPLVEPPVVAVGGTEVDPAGGEVGCGCTPGVAVAAGAPPEVKHFPLLSSLLVASLPQPLLPSPTGGLEVSPPSGLEGELPRVPDPPGEGGPL